MRQDDETVGVYDARAAEYAAMVGAKPDAALVAFMADIPAGGRVLDLGCGPAAASAHMRAAGLVPDPVDASQGMVDLANETYGIGARLGVFDDIAGVADYDGVWANFCLLHAPREALPRHLGAIAKCLKPFGQFHIGMKTGDGAQRDAIGRMYTYVTVAELREMLTDAGFKVTAERVGFEAGFAGTEDPFVVMRAVKHG